MAWTLFKYENGSNPYVAMTEKEAKKIINKYKNRIEKKAENFYYIKEQKTDKKIKGLYPLF
jgi:hypothetical protein